MEEKNSFLKIQKKKKKTGNEIADFQNATNANKKEAKKKRKKLFFENKKNQETRLPLFKMQPTSAAAPSAARYKGTAISTKTPKRNIVFHRHQHDKTKEVSKRYTETQMLNFRQSLPFY